MAFFETLLRVLFPEPPGPTRPKDPVTTSVYRYQGPEIEIDIYVTETLLEENGFAPELVAVRYLARAFEIAGYNYAITSALSPVPIVDDFEDVLDLHDSWVGYALTDPAKDCNLLLTTRSSGGASGVGGRRAVAPASHIDRDVSWKARGEGDLHRNLHAIMHEVGHSLGASHDHDDEQEGAQHWGMGWIEDAKWHQTPTVGGHGAENLCGEWIESRPADLPVVQEHYFNRCATERFDLK